MNIKKLTLFILAFVVKNTFLFSQKQESDLVKFQNHHTTVKLDSIFYDKLLRYKSQTDYFNVVSDPLTCEKSTTEVIDLYARIGTQPIIKILLKDSIYLYVTARISDFHAKNNDTSFLARIYDNKTQTILHKFDILKFGKAKLFTCIAIKKDTIKYYVNIDERDKRKTSLNECNPPLTCVLSVCYNFVLRNNQLEYVGLMSRHGAGIINRRKFYFTEPPSVYKENSKP